MATNDDSRPVDIIDITPNEFTGLYFGTLRRETLMVKTYFVYFARCKIPCTHPHTPDVIINLFKIKYAFPQSQKCKFTM